MALVAWRVGSRMVNGLVCGLYHGPLRVALRTMSGRIGEYPPGVAGLAFFFHMGAVKGKARLEVVKGELAATLCLTYLNSADLPAALAAGLCSGTVGIL